MTVRAARATLRAMLQKILGPDPKTTLGGILLSLGLAATQANTFGFSAKVCFAGTMVAAVGAALLGKSAVDANKRSS